MEIKIPGVETDCFAAFFCLDNRELFFKLGTKLPISLASSGRLKDIQEDRRIFQI